MGSAALLRPPRGGFIRLYHFTTADYAIQAISLRRLKVARFSDLNDPFELEAVNFREARTRRIVRAFKDQYGERTGLLSFSADWTNPLLWSHYSAKHQGICLGFNVMESEVEHVRYEDVRIRDAFRDGDPGSLSEDLQQQLLCTKYSGWSYEDEWRRFIPLDDTTKQGRFQFFGFDATIELAEVILGTQCSADVLQVAELATKLHPTVDAVLRGRLMHKDFKIVPDEFNPAWFAPEYRSALVPN
ncbi:MAG TPA: DUF2971 domain-containing protein [Burkholderiales bacterium]|nr:DUF2971 domain-containing protein [Burkholderiales bacterium]